MVRVKYFDKKDKLLSSSLHYYYSLTFLRVEIKDWTNSKFSLDIKRRRKKCVMAASLHQLKKIKGTPW